MKKKIILIGLLSLMINITPVFASTNTKERTEENYLISSDIKITESNKNNILSTPAIDEKEKIYDFADLFTEEEEQKLYQKISQYIDSYQLDLALVTISQNNKSSPREYADDFYDYNNFGFNNTKDGLLFLIDMDNREIYMTTTGAAINMYNDYRINKALEQVYQYMTNQNYYQGVLQYIQIIGDYAKSGLPGKQDQKNLTTTICYSIIISLIITIIIMVILINKNKLVRKKTTAREYLNKDSVSMKNIGEILVSTNTVRHAINHSSSSGSSTHSGSSGRSHGGGGHRF